MYTTLLVSPGLTFGTVSALFGLWHEIVTQRQYSALVGAVIGSAVVPTPIAKAFFLPRHRLGRHDRREYGAAVHGVRGPREEGTMIRNILLGYDGSGSANMALDFAVNLARAFNAQLHVLAVARPPEFADEVETQAVIEHLRQRSHQVLRTAHAKLANAPFKVHFQVAVGHPAEQIVRYAEANGIDHIVVGHRGHTLFERWLIGSVARQVIAYAHCAVTVARRQQAS